MGCSSSSEASNCEQNKSENDGLRGQDPKEAEHDEEDEEEDDDDVVGEMNNGANVPQRGKRKQGGEMRRLAVMVEKEFQYIDESDPDSLANEDPEKLEYYEKSEEETSFLKEAISKVFIFQGIPLDSPSMTEFIGSFNKTSFLRGTNIMTEGEKGDELYVLFAGEARVTTERRDKSDETKVQYPRQFSISKPDKSLNMASIQPRNSITLRKLVKGDLFGELALLYNTTRAATVVAYDDVETFVTTRKAFRKTMLHSSQKILMTFLRDVPLFRYLTNNSLNKVAQLFTIENIEHNEEIVPYGAPPGNFMIVKNGMVIKIKPQNVKHEMIDEVGIHGVIPAIMQSTNNGSLNNTEWNEKEMILETLGRCQFFGDRPIYSGECFDGQYVAGPDGAQLLVMTKDSFEST